MVTRIPQKIANSVKEQGGKALFIGGCVRDEIMGITPKDIDIEVYGITPEKLKELLRQFGKIDAVGESFTVFKIDNSIDISIPRREKKVGTGHKGFEVQGDPDMSVVEASRRRDFTINSVSKDILTGEIIDPFGGQADIRKKRIRYIDAETFKEDSLRVLRAAQFASRFKFRVTPSTINLCKTIDLTDLPSERLWGEIEKLLMKSEYPSIGFHCLYELGIADQLFPEIVALKGVQQEFEWHPEGDVDIHTGMVINEAKKLLDGLEYPQQVTVMLASLCHDFGKPATTEFKDGRIRAHGHSDAGLEPTESFLNTLNIYTLDGYDVRTQVLQLVKYHLLPGEFYRQKDVIRDITFNRIARKVELDLLHRVHKADSLGRNPEFIPEEKWFKAESADWFIEKVEQLDIKVKAPAPILMGRHLIQLGMSPSKEFGTILEQVYEKQLEGTVTDLDGAGQQLRLLYPELCFVNVDW